LVDSMASAHHQEVRNALTVARAGMQLVPIASLSGYERPNENRVAQIFKSLEQTKILINPVIVDANLNLLIDGHHRIEAFKWVGLKQIPAFNVSYLSNDVRVESWARVTRAPVDKIVSLFDALVVDVTRGRWSVVATSGGFIIRRRFFDEVMDAANYLERFKLCLSAYEYAVEIEPEPMPLAGNWSGKVHIYTDPVVGKDEVLGAVRANKRFPYQVNRHLINNRPIGMRFPLDVLGSVERFEKFVDKVFARGLPSLITGGTVLDGRSYAENVITFSKAD